MGNYKCLQINVLNKVWKQLIQNGRVSEIDLKYGLTVSSMMLSKYFICLIVFSFHVLISTTFKKYFLVISCLLALSTIIL